MKVNKNKLIIALSLLFLVVIIVSACLFFEKKYKNKVYPGVYFNQVSLSGLNESEVRDLINIEINNFDLKGVNIVYKNESFLWKRDSSSFDPDLSFQSVFFDLDTVINRAFSFGRSGDFLTDLKFKTESLYKKNTIEMSFNVDRNKVLNQIETAFDGVGSFTKDAKLESNYSYNEPFEGEIDFSVVEEEYGKSLNKDIFFSQFEESIRFLDSRNIYLEFIESSPSIKSGDIENLKDEALDLLSIAPFYLKNLKDGKEESFIVSKEVFSTWLKIERNDDGDLYFSLDYDNVVKFFETDIIDKVNKEKIEPQFEFENNRVSVFYPGQDGLVLDYEKSFSNVLNFFLMREMDNIFLEFSIQEVNKVDSINDLGIKEIIGVGKSSFLGSPSNRVHNIRVGTNKFTGLIIAPDEEFSFIEYLGTVDADSGYLPELVIKGDRTIPEYGGGLCQVSTTVFRAALNTGLPITARSNHSYRVSYYEPAGTDATIYNPWPDLRFKNDTGHNILIQSEIIGGDLFFYFWGTSDNRKVEVSDPVIYNIIKPGPTRIIETTDLKPGERRCTERAINGADAYLDYKVTYNPNTSEENIVEKRFYSKYVPWTEVCLVGVEEKVEPETEDIVE